MKLHWGHNGCVRGRRKKKASVLSSSGRCTWKRRKDLEGRKISKFSVCSVFGEMCGEKKKKSVVSGKTRAFEGTRAGVGKEE